MSKIEMYSTALCPYCRMAKASLEDKGLDIQIIPVQLPFAGKSGDENFTQMLQRTGRRTVPQIFINDIHIGGAEDLMRLEQSGQLDKLLNQQEIL